MPTTMVHFGRTILYVHSHDDSAKRRKLSSDHNIVNIGDLPDESLESVAAFLSKPSQALFAVAMTSPIRKSPWKLLPSDGNNDQSRNNRDREAWEMLDFGEIEVALARKLSDDDIRAVFLCIDAAKRLKTLRLSGCANITGRGLIPLKGSTVLKQIDLSIVRGEGTFGLKSEPLLDEHLVIPILDSIIHAKGNSLSQVQLPKKFRVRPSEVIDTFIEKYDEFLEERGDICSRCNVGNSWGGADGGGTPWVFDDHKSPLYGLQSYTCYECISHVCLDICLQFCTRCEKCYCADCMTFTICRYCPTQLCKSCGELTTCKLCSYHSCDSCSSMGECNQRSCLLPETTVYHGDRGMW